MSQQAVELLLRGYRAFVAGDLETIESMLDPEVEWIGVGEVSAIAVASTTLREPEGAGAIARSCAA